MIFSDLGNPGPIIQGHRCFPITCDEKGLREALERLPCCTTNANGTLDGGPVNLVLVGEMDEIFSAFLDRQWNMTEEACLSNDDAIKAIYHAAEGVILSAAPGNIIIEMSTISPGISRDLWRAAKERDVEVLDVAISGGPPMAEDGSLTLLAGGSEQSFNDCEPIFAAIAKQYFHLGPSGSGTAMKLVVNTVLGVSMQAIAEAIALGERLGIERGRLLDVLSRTAVIAPAQQYKLARAGRNDYSAQSAISLMNKDFHLIMEQAAALHVPMPTVAAAFQMNLAHMARYPDEDYSGVIAQMEELSGVGVPNPAGAK